MIHQKWTTHRSLTDHEVVWGAEFYRNLSNQLIQCGPAFALAHAQASNIAEALEDFRKNRGI